MRLTPGARQLRNIPFQHLLCLCSSFRLPQDKFKGCEFDNGWAKLCLLSQTMAANRDRLALIEDISGIGGDHSADLRETLDRVATTIAAGMEVEVCSIYLFDAQRERLVLRASVGFDRESVGRVSMKVNEGLVGLAIESGEPVVVADAMSHPRYKYFPETAEERYHTFVAVPIEEGRRRTDRGIDGADAAAAQSQPG